MQDTGLKQHGKELVKIMQTRPDELPDTILSLDDESKALSGSKIFLERHFNCEFSIQEKPSHDPQGKSKHALPMKPGLFIE
jgi:hypothetical protein